MKSIKAGSKVVIAAQLTDHWGTHLLHKTVRARVLRGGRGRVYVRVEPDELVVQRDRAGRLKQRCVTGAFDADAEGTLWARGWDTEEANALCALAALA